MKTAAVKIKNRTIRIKADTGYARDLNRITTKHSAFESFQALVDSHPSYRPSIYLDGKPKQDQRELVYLAWEYNSTMERRKDSRRVYCGDFQFLNGETNPTE